jgi:uncharacterized protein YndB with AHSA1/START domain
MTETKLSGTILDGESQPEGPGAGTVPRNSVVTECDLPEAPEKVWKALTTPELLAAWLPDAVNSEILAAEPNRLLRYRWPGREGDRDERGRTLESVVTFELTGTRSGGTHLRVVHRLVSASSNIVAFRGRRKEPFAMLSVAAGDSGSLRAPCALASGSSGVYALRLVAA